TQVFLSKGAQSLTASLDRITIFLGIWRFMKTTLDLPDELMREVKIRAVHEHKKLKDAIAEFIRKGMAAGKPGPAKVPKPIKLRRGFVPTAEDIEAAIAWGRD
ncbi:MAG TPA: hypothetical protein VJ248_11365, partial [Candidatus Udaeobacter sp.]|nr:hypothetical protein [Candidatus Udaeobacter sp.]